MRRLPAVLAALLLAVAVAAPVAAGPQPPAGPFGPPVIGLVTDGPILYDSGFNEEAWNGVEAGASAIGAKAIVAISHNPSDAMYARNIRRLINRGADVIVTVGFLETPATLAAANAFPDVQFFGVDQGIDVAWPDNYQGLLFAAAESGYLAGIVAVHTTASGTVATVGVMDPYLGVVPDVRAFMNGYRNGVFAVDSSVDVTVGYAGSFQDPAEGYAVASALIGDGADVVFGVAGFTTAGVLGAACGAGVWGIGVDVDDWQVLPDTRSCTITSALKRVDVASSLAVERWWSGGTPELQSGIFLNRAANGGIGIAPLRNIEPSTALSAALDAAYAGLADGSIDPCNPYDCDTVP